MSREPSEFVESLTTAIIRRADNYVGMLDASQALGELRTGEAELLDKFEAYAADVLDRYNPPGARRRDSLVFAHLYSGITSATEERRRALITALLAAETESRGPLRLTQAQNLRLAQIYERLGERLLSNRLPLHAALAFERAAGTYLQVEEHLARDRCLLAQARARHRARPFGWVKALETLSEVSCGYGYQPYRLLSWVVFQLAAFTLLLTLVTDKSVIQSIYLCLVAYISPLGTGDVSNMSRAESVLFVVEGYAGVLSLSVFFALVVRRWFRA
jgi:hypothetical protein